MYLISNRTRLLEISAVVLTAAGKFLFVDYWHARTLFFITAIILWTAYIAYRSKKNPAITKYWGFRTDNAKQTIMSILPFAFVALIIFVGIGIFQKTINLTWHIIPILILYPIWGIIQQFLLIGLTTGNLNDMNRLNIPKAIIIILPALLFGIIHYPYFWLIIGSGTLGMFYGWIYLKQRNLYVLGVFHGWLGALFFYKVVNRDPFMEVFGPLLTNYK